VIGWPRIKRALHSRGWGGGGGAVQDVKRIIFINFFIARYKKLKPEKQKLCM
jgi:hypothetical protein